MYDTQRKTKYSRREENGLNTEENALLEALLEQVQKPARYTGGEMNSAVRPFGSAEIRFASTAGF